MGIVPNESELHESVYQLAQSQIDLFLDTLYARKQTKSRHFNQSGEAMSGVTGSGIFFRDTTTYFRGNEYFKNRVICDCAGELSHAITTLLSNSLAPLMLNA